MKTATERGVYGRWLTHVREARGYRTAAAARTALAEAGIQISHSTYAEYESGAKQPSKVHLPLLERFWGPVYDPEPSAGDDALSAAIGRHIEVIVAAMDRQTAMLQAVLFTLAGRSLSPELQEWAGQQYDAIPKPLPSPDPVG